MATNDSTLTQEYLKQVLSYNCLTGTFFWLVQNSNRVKIGDIAGCIYTDITSKKYRKVNINKKTHLMHRLAWLYVYGEFPKQEIDHIDGNGLNNRISNLRDVSRLENSKNTRLRKGNKSGVPGILWSDKRKKWIISISINTRRVTLGYRFDFFEACCLRKSSEYKNGYHPNNGSKRPL